MKCTKCQAEIENGEKSCPACGQPVEEEVISEEIASEEAPEATVQPTTEENTPAPESEGGFFAKLLGKIKEIAAKCDEKIGEKLGDKKTYAYAGVIGLIGLVIVVSVIAAIIPNGNGYLGYDRVVGFDVMDDKVYMMAEGKAIALKTDAESVGKYSSSIDGKVSVFMSDGALYTVKGKKAVKIAEDVSSYTLSLYGDYVVYCAVDGIESTYYHCKVSNGKATEMFEYSDDEFLVCYAISPNGKNVAYVTVDEEYEGTLYYFNGKKSTKITKRNAAVVGLSDGGKYIYCVEESKSGKTSLISYNKKGKETKIDSCDYDDGFCFNLDASEIMYYSNGKTYVSVKAKKPVKVASNELYLITPDGVTTTYKAGNNSFFYPVDSLFEHVYTSGNAVYFVSRKESKNVKLVKTSNTKLDNTAQYLYYMDKNDLMVLEIAKGEKAEDKAKLIAEDVDFFRITSDRKLAYIINEDNELCVVNGKKGGKVKRVSSEEVEMMDPVISSDDIVYFYSDGSIYAVNGKKAKKIIEDAMYGAEGGYVYIMDEDSLYVARGTRSPKKLVSID